MRHKAFWVCCALLGACAWAQGAAPRAADAGSAASAEARSAAQPPSAPAAATKAVPAEAAQKPAEVRVGDTVVFTLRASRAGKSAALRARAANEALREALVAKADDVHVESAGGVAAVYVGGRPVVQLTPEDAALAGDSSLAVHADRIAAEIRAAFAAERKRSAVAGTIFNVSLAVLFAVVAVFVLRRVWQLADRAGDWLESHPERVPALHLRSLELLNRSTVRGALWLGLGAGRWIVLIGLVYAWLIATFSLFQATQDFTGRLSGALISPLAALASRVAATVPLMVLVVFALLALALVLRAVRLFFGEVARGATTVAWLPRDLAAPTGLLVEIALVILALLLVAPVITGDADGSAPHMGLLLLGAIALASVPLLACAVVGVATLFGRWLRVGDWVELGARAGRVVRLGLLETTLRDAAGVEVRVPHLARLVHPARVHGPMPRASASLPVERALATPALAGRLERALAAVGTPAVVRLVDVGATHATLELTIASAAADARSACLWAALAELDAARRECG